MSAGHPCLTEYVGTGPRLHTLHKIAFPWGYSENFSSSRRVVDEEEEEDDDDDDKEMTEADQ